MDLADVKPMKIAIAPAIAYIVAAHGVNQDQYGNDMAETVVRVQARGAVIPKDLDVDNNPTLVRYFPEGPRQQRLGSATKSHQHLLT